MNASELGWWYWLSSVKWLGPANIRNLLDALGDPRDVFEASRSRLEQSVKMPNRIWDALERSKEFALRYEVFAERQIRAARAMGAQILTLHDSAYPEFLSVQRKQAPPVLHLKGNVDLIGPRAVAVVGTRSPTFEAIEHVYELATRLCGSSCPVVAGMARGIDTAAHRGALDSCGMTIGVLGSGLDRVYPPENRGLYAEAADRGLLVSQFPFGSAPTPDNLRQRNKLIAALVDALVVAESGIPGGALIAARAALEQGKNLFVLPWEQWDMPSRTGNRRLLEARLAQPANVNDIEALFHRSVFLASGAGLEKAWRAAFPPSAATTSLATSNYARTAERARSSRRHPPMTKRPHANDNNNNDVDVPNGSSTAEARPRRPLRAGDSVTHAVHGRGKVVEVRDDPEGRRVVVTFRKDGLRVSLPTEAAEVQLVRQ